MQNKTYDFTIVGAGIVGLSTAYKLSLALPDAKILILEKEPKVATHQTGKNSGVIHSGIYYKPGSYKAQNCIDGRHQLVEFCKENNVAIDICGKVIVATEESELERLAAIYERGLENGIEGLARTHGNVMDSWSKNGKEWSGCITIRLSYVHSKYTDFYSGVPFS